MIICDEYQLSCLNEHGPDFICIDSTFGVAHKYNLKFTAIMVINEFGVGVPVVYIISNNLKTATMKDCFIKIKDVLGKCIKTNVFMSDNDSTYCNAWCDGMGTPTRRLLCTWHISKAWKKN